MSKDEDLGDIVSNPQINANALQSEAKKKAAANRLYGHWFALTVISTILLLLQAVGIGYFTRGFLLTRPVFEEKSTCEDVPMGVKSGQGECWSAKSIDKVVMIIIDALRFDFVIPVEDELYYHNHFPILYDYATKYPQNAFLSKFMADPPTTTLQRLKGLTTGSLPTFIDAGSNFAGTEIDEDNWISQLSEANKTITFMGDDTWDALFGNNFHTNMTWTYDSLNVWDLHTVDNGVIEHIFPSLRDEYGQWDVAIGHLLGVDHAGHRYGPNHPLMKDKLQEMNQFVKNLTEAVDDHTLLIVMGDHGMDPKGDHGGDSKLELESTLWLYSKQKLFSRTDSTDISNYGENYRTVSQIDLVPTVSLLLGLPIPYNNLGFPIDEVFMGPKNNLKAFSDASLLTAAQIRRYRSKFEQSEKENDLWESVTMADSLKDVIAASRRYQDYTLAKCRDEWVNFDMAYIYIGIALTAMSLIIVMSCYSSLATLEPIKVARWLVMFSGIAGVLFWCLDKFIFKLTANSLYSSGFGVAFGIIGSSFITVVSSQRNRAITGATIFALMLALCHSLIFTSNSYSVWEDGVLNYFLASAGIFFLARSFTLATVEQISVSVWHSAVFIALSKISSFSTLCREEQGQACITTYYESTTSSVSSPYALGGLIFVSAALPLFVKSFYQTSASYNGSAPVWIGIGMRIIMGLSCLYWIIDGVETNSWDVGFSYDTLKSIKFMLARICLGATLVAGNYGWYAGAMCVRIDFVKKPDSADKVNAVILGYSNVYGSFYFLALLNFFCAVLIVTKPMGGIVLCGLVYQILTLIDLIDLHELNNTALGPIILGLLGSSYFFSTGHHATLPAIQWEIGFVPVSTITFPLTHVALVLNTFGPVILTTLAVPLTVFWKMAPSTNPIRLQSRVMNALMAYMSYHTVLTLGSMIWTTVLRRHLMLWKVFAPRYMLAGLTLVVVDVVIVIALGLSQRVIWYINNIFG